MGTVELVPTELVDYVDVSPKQVVSVATAMILSWENDDAITCLQWDRALQRQAVPLVKEKRLL